MKKLVVIFIVFTFFSGCYQGYRINIDQGNSVSEEQLEKLKLGMTRKEVQFLMGTPLIKDPFHANRWDYIYNSGTTNKSSAKQNQLSLLFTDDILVGINRLGNEGLENNKKNVKKKNIIGNLLKRIPFMD